MVLWRDRERARDIEIRGKRKKKRDAVWDMLMSPVPISPTSQKFEPNLTVGTNYSYTSFTKEEKK